ncbi:MAG: membrane integrity-associated transporter subunit PqiC [Proteobacteria bacterium]|nr:membrane integrity-associated transporter subunit PqiC [Pseudomonadota bacterium]
MSTAKYVILSVILTIFFLGIAGCGGLTKPAVTKRYYDIGPQRTNQVQAAPSDQTLTVRRLRVSPMNAGRELVYKTSDTGYDSDFYNAYFIPPGDMLSQALRRWLHATGLFAHVVEPASLVRGDLVLEGNVVALYGDFTGSGEAVAELQFILVDEGTAETAILFSKDYSKRIPLSQRTPEALAAGLKQAMAEVFAELEADLASALP